MFSIRKQFLIKHSLAAVALATLAPLTGCNLKAKQPVQPAMNPTVEDEAMVRRQWRQTDALYANSGVEAYANRFRYNYETTAQQTPAAGAIVGPLAFVAQTFTFPFTFLRAAPGAKETYRPLTIEPTFTGIPEREPLTAVNEAGTAVDEAGTSIDRATPNNARPTPTVIDATK